MNQILGDSFIFNNNFTKKFMFTKLFRLRANLNVNYYKNNSKINNSNLDHLITSQNTFDNSNSNCLIKYQKCGMRSMKSKRKFSEKENSPRFDELCTDKLDKKLL